MFLFTNRFAMLISVALCTYNGERFLTEQLESILNQTLAVTEIVVCDDGSQDQTHAILQNYQQRYPNLFRVYINEKNVGSSKNFENALDLCTGDIIFFADQDDTWRADKVALTLSLFNQNTGALGVFSDAHLINEMGQPIFEDIGLWSSVKFFPHLLPFDKSLFHSLTLMGNFLTGATLCVKKEVKSMSIPFKTSDSLRFIHDEWLAFLLVNTNQLVYSKEKLMSYRLHQNQQLGVGKIHKIQKKFRKAKNYYSLMLSDVQPNNFFQYIKKKRTLFNQFTKYAGLSQLYEYEPFKVAKNSLYNALLALDNHYKKQNILLYYFRRFTDYIQSKRAYRKLM